MALFLRRSSESSQMALYNSLQIINILSKWNDLVVMLCLFYVAYHSLEYSLDIRARCSYFVTFSIYFIYLFYICYLLHIVTFLVCIRRATAAQMYNLNYSLVFLALYFCVCFFFRFRAKCTFIQNISLLLPRFAKLIQIFISPPHFIKLKMHIHSFLFWFLFSVVLIICLLLKDEHIARLSHLLSSTTSSSSTTTMVDEMFNLTDIIWKLMRFWVVASLRIWWTAMPYLVEYFQRPMHQVLIY